MKKGILIYIILMIIFSIFFYFNNSHAITQYGYYGESDEWRAFVVNENKDGFINYFEKSRPIGRSFAVVEYIGKEEKYLGKQVKVKISRKGLSHSKGSAAFETMVLDSLNHEIHGTFIFRDKGKGDRSVFRVENNIYFIFEVEGVLVEKLMIDQPLIEEININDYYKHSAKWNRIYRKYGIID